MKTSCPSIPDTSARLTAKAWEMFDAELSFYTSQPLVDGAWIFPETGMDEPSQVGQGRWFMVLATALIAGRGKRDDLLAALADCGTYWLRARRPSGRIDLRNCNADSGPDTAFLLEQIHSILKLVDLLAPTDDDLANALKPAIAFARDAASAMGDAGIHTPNHRWAVASAIALSIVRWPEMRFGLEPVLKAFLAEEPDLDADGAFLERSVAVYDAVTIRSFLNIHESVGWSAGLEAARRNMEFDWTLFHADGTVDTRLSHRYDLGSRPVPLSLVTAWLQLARVDANPWAAQRASWIFEQVPRDIPNVRHLIVPVIGELLRGNSFVNDSLSPEDIEIFHPANALVRIRRSRTSISLHGHNTCPASILNGRIALAAIRAGQSYFGHGRFLGNEIRPVSGGWELSYRGHLPEYPLGYSQALGEKVPPSAWSETFSRRELRSISPCRSRLQFGLLESGDGLRIVYESVEGLDGIPAQITFDFEPGPRWESGALAFQPSAGQTLVLKDGFGRMVSGTDWLELGPGHSGHLPWEMRDYPKVGSLVRVAIPLVTPFTYELTIRWNVGS